MIALGRFQKPIRISTRAVGWPEHIIRSWLIERIADSEQKNMVGRGRK
ncbi:helix-turn-helix transcriptional regulator [Methylobacterium sp. Gmos1]